MKLFFYVCFFCNNQYRIIVEESQNGSDDLDSIFEARLLSCGRLVALLDDWKKPTYCTRIWTIYEQFVAQKLEIPTELIMPPEANTSLKNEFMRGSAGIEEISMALSNVKSKDAVATRKVDELKVKQMIETSVGFATVDTKVVACLVKCAVQQFHAYLTRQVSTLKKSSDLEEPKVGRAKSSWRSSLA